MNNKEINLLLIEKFPEFKDSYNDAIALDCGDDSSLYTTFSYVVAVELHNLASLLPSSEAKIIEIFTFLDYTIDNHEEAEDVIVTCVLEYIFYSHVDLKTLYPYMPERIVALSNAFYK